MRSRSLLLWTLTGSLTLALGACSSESKGDPDPEAEDGDSQDKNEQGSTSEEEDSSSEDDGNSSSKKEDEESKAEDDDEEPGDGTEDKGDDGNSDDSDSDSNDSSSESGEDEDDEEEDEGEEFQDKALQKCVEQALEGGNDDDSDNPSKRNKIGDLKYLECRNMGIESLAGIQRAKALTGLSLFENKIKSIKALSALKKLEFVQLGNNRIESLKPLEKLSGLKRVGLAVNDIESVEPLAKLKKLEWLNLDVNKVSDVSALEKLDKLSWVTVDYNEIKDKKSVEALEAKGVLVYSDNQRGGIAERKSSATLLGEPAPTRSIESGTLRLVKDQRGAASFVYDTPQGSFPTISEWEGELAEVDGQLLLHRGQEQRAIGTSNANGISLCEGSFAEDCQLLIGIKNDGLVDLAPGEVAEPVVSVNIQIKDRWENREGRVILSTADGSMDKEVMPFIFASPNQFDAGSCANMAAVGTMEVLLNQIDAIKSLDYESKNNLSEAFFMVIQEKVKGVPYYFTDCPLNFNNIGGGLPDKLMPFKVSSQGSAQQNWNNPTPSDWKSKLIETPRVERTVLFFDPPRDQLSKWNVGLMDEKVVERIKFELRTKNAPVYVVYNHYKYWHVSVVVGYDDNEEHEECPMVKSTLKFYEKDKDQSKSGVYTKKINDHMKKLGGCSKKGYFYVRDSIYKGTTKDPMYDYGGTKPNGRYSQRIVKREYEWIWYLSNHATAVYRGRN